MSDASGVLHQAGRHATAIVDDSARIDESATIGPFSVIGPGVEIGARVRIGPHVTIERDTRIGDDCRVWPGAVLGTDPQDLKYVGERTWLEIGPRTRIREYATLNRATAATGRTLVGEDCLLMAYSHVAHDCRLADHVVLANAVNLAGHVQIGEWAILGGVSGVHQFVRIGRHAMVGGASRVLQDVAPYTLVAGNPCTAYGLNRIGLKRRGFPEETLGELKAAYRRLFHSDVPTGRAAEELCAMSPGPEVRELARFVLDSSRGITTPAGRADAAPDAPPFGQDEPDGT